jgi:hypothetical protein
MIAVTRRIAGLLPAAALQLVAVVLAHELVFLARYGSLYGEALVHAGHGETWNAAVGTSFILAAGLAGVGAIRLAHLGLLVRRHRPAPEASIAALEPRPLLRAWLRVTPRMALLGVVLLSLQENLERASIGQALPGPAILLTPDYAGGLWITIAVGLAVGLVAALFDWRRRVLLAKLRAARPSVPRGATVPQRRPGVVVVRPVESRLGRRSALRAPPHASAS